MPARLVLIGLDAVEPTLVRRWAADGTMPALASLLSRGTSGSVRAVQGFYVGSTWPSFSTGLDPAGHGFHRIEQLEVGGYEFARPLESPAGVGGTPFWARASAAGQRVAVLDVPLTRLETDLNGIQMIEWGCHDSVFGFHAAPPELANRLLETVGPYPVPGNCDAPRPAAADFDEFARTLEHAVQLKSRLTRDILAQDEWDLLIQVFTEGHCAGHQCWHLHDPSHPAHDEAAFAVASDPVERVYRALDRAVAEIVEQAAEARVIVFSAHGMGSYRGADFLLAEILYRLGATTRPEISLRLPSTLGTRVSGRARAVWSATPWSIRERLRPFRARLATTGPPGARGVEAWADVGTSRCFPVPNGGPVSAVRLNVAGREPRGLLQPGSEVSAFCDQLAQELLAVVDERTGAPLIAAVTRTDELFSGVRRDSLPDLLVVWNDVVPTGSLAHAGGRGAVVRARSATIGVVEGRNSYGRTGEHVDRGFFVSVGQGVPAVERSDPVNVTDFHPTVCSLLGLPTGAVDGKAIPELAAPLL